jgi:MFS family permease
MHLKTPLYFPNLRFGRDMQTLVVSMVIANFGARIHERFFPLYVRDLGASIQDLGWVMTLTSAIMMIFGPLGGWIADRYSRNVILALGPAIGAVAALSRAAAPTWTWLVPGMILANLPGLIVSPAAFGLVSDLAPPGRRGAFYGYQGMVLGLCAAIGPLAGGVAYQNFGYRTILLGDAVLLIIAATMRYRIHDPRETRRKAEGRRGMSFPAAMRAFRDLARDRPQTIRFLIVNVVAALGSALFTTFASLYARERLGLSLAALGAAIGTAALLAVPASLAGGVLADRWGRKTVLLIGLAAAAVQAGLLTRVGNAWQLTALLSVAAVTQALASPAGQAMLADLVPSDQRGTFLSISNSASWLVVVPAPVLGSLVWSHLGPAVLFQAAAVILVLAAALLVLLVAEPRRHPAGA